MMEFEIKKTMPFTIASRNKILLYKYTICMWKGKLQNSAKKFFKSKQVEKYSVFMI